MPLKRMPETSDKYECEQCHRNFAERKNLNHHLKNHEKQGIFKCSLCEKECLTKGSLRQHMKDHNMEHSICKYCEKTFPLKRYLQEHIVRTHRERKFFQCTVCPSKLKTRQALERHEQVQHNSSATHKIDCTVCGKSFIGRNTIKVHMKII